MRGNDRLRLASPRLARLLAALVAAVFGWLITPTAASAHPADEASVFHYLWVEPSPGQLVVEHATVVGGLLTHAVWSRLDTDGDDQISVAEEKAYSKSLADLLLLTVNGKRVRWAITQRAFPSKEQFFAADLDPVALRLTAPLPQGASRWQVEVRDETYPEFRGVFPNPVVRASGLSAAEPIVGDDGRRFELLLQRGAGNPPVAIAPGDSPVEKKMLPRPKDGEARVDSAVTGPLAEGSLGPTPRLGMGKVLSVGPDSANAAGIESEPGHNESGTLRRFLGTKLTPGLLLLALSASVVAGAAHALAPGHGKTMVAAYLVGSRGTVWDAVLLGIVVTITHTASVYLLGFLCLWLTTRIQAEVVATWLSIGSGAAVLVMGFWLMQRGLLAYHGVRPLPGHNHAHDGGHSHSHTHSHGDALGHDCGADSTQTTGSPPGDAPLGEAAMASAAPARRSRAGIIGLGVAGGMVPCFDALAILIAAVNLKNVPLGLMIIAAFSVGMAVVLVAVGVLMVTAKGWMSRITGDGPFVRALPAISGGIVFFLGTWLTLSGLRQAGLIQF